MVGGLLVLVTLAVIQLGLVLHVRNTVLDAASEGARFAALADNSLADGVGRTQDLIATAIGETYVRDISARYGTYRGQPATIITVRATLPIVGLVGPTDALEVVGHAARETLGNR